MRQKNKNMDFLGTCYQVHVFCLLGNLLTGKEVKATILRRGIIRADEGKIRAGEGRIRAS